MRVLLDVSVLGLGHTRPELRGGVFRVHEQMAEGLARSAECELTLCANHSSVAFTGCVEYLASNAVLRDIPLIGGTARDESVGRVTRWAYSTLRRAIPGGRLPEPMRRRARAVDARLRGPVRDAEPPVDIFHSLGAALPTPVAGRRAPRRVVNIYDLAPLRLPALYGEQGRELAASRLAGVTPRDWVITTSESSRQDLVDVARLDAGRVFVVPLAAPQIGVAPTRPGVDDPFVLLLHAHDPRKNIATAVRACAIDGLTVVIAGPGTFSADLNSACVEAEAGGARIVRTGFVGDDELASLFAHATAFVYPSLYEGFGLPLLEAMQCGTPVVAGCTSSIPEVVGDAGLLVDASDVSTLGDAIRSVWRDPALRATLAARGRRRAAMFTWDRTVRETLGVYRTMLDAGNA